LIVGFLSDAHGNEGALLKGLDTLRGLGADRLFYLGDSVGYVPSKSVLVRLSERAPVIQCVRGNHEALLLHDSHSPEEELVYLLRYTRGLLSKKELEFLVSWPSEIREEIDGNVLLLVHGSPSDPISGYVYPDTDLSQFSPQSDFVFMGNTHHPMVSEFGPTTYVNVGSCGLPRDDGRFGSVALLDTYSRKVNIYRFNIERETREMFDTFHMIHPSVRELFSRRSDNLKGEIL